MSGIKLGNIVAIYTIVRDHNKYKLLILINPAPEKYRSLATELSYDAHTYFTSLAKRGKEA